SRGCGAESITPAEQGPRAAPGGPGSDGPGIRGVRDPDEQVVPLAAHLESRHVRVGIVQTGARGDVVFPEVPGAEHAGADDRALAERPAAMRAGSVDRMELAAEVEEGDRNAPGVHGHARARSDVAGLRHLPEFGHRFLPAQSMPSWSLAASDIIEGFQGGSQTTST